ncbi:zinc ribbon domain-containing protein [Patescibacteria group bacterium]
MKKNKFCQSCGMPFSKDPQGGGTEQDGAKSIKYCSFCYQNGEFTSPEIDTPEKMQKFCIVKMKEQGMSKFIAWIFTRGIPRLERWKK